MIGGKTTPSTGNKDVEVVVIDDDDDDDDDDVDSSEEDDDLDAADFFGESFESVGTFIGGRPLVCGGGSTSTDLVKCWKYDKASNTWSQESFGLKQGRIDAAAVRVYLVFEDVRVAVAGDDESDVIALGASVR